jgi:hypothetical protein
VEKTEDAVCQVSTKRTKRPQKPGKKGSFAWNGDDRTRGSGIAGTALPQASTRKKMSGHEPVIRQNRRRTTIRSIRVIEPVADQESYLRALSRIESIWNAEPGSPEERELDAWATLVDAYERRIFPILPFDPVQAEEEA